MLRWFTMGSNVRPPPRKETYEPPLVRGDGPPEEVAEKFRDLRLRRRRTATMTRTPLIVHFAIVIAIIGFLSAIAAVALSPI